MSLFVAFGAIAQRTVSGKITSAEDGASIPGVNVVLKGTTTGTTSDLDGNYRLSVPEEGGTLVFSFIGLEAQETEIGARSVIDIGMASDVTELTEVVVTAFGIERQEKSLTYAVQEMKGEDMTQARETNLVNSLSGKVAGVQITNSSGAPGSSSRIVLRGSSSISGSNEPLFVIDGVPIDNGSYGAGGGSFGAAGSGGGANTPNGAADLNPDDIASISVLKGPVAAGLYGNRAANGVILITTKKGGDSKGFGVSVNSSTMFSTPLRIPDFQNSYGQGASDTYFEFVDGQNGFGDGVDESWGPPLDVGLNFVQWDDYNGDGTYDAPSPWVSYPDNVRDFYETGVTLSNNVSFSGGDMNNSFRLSLTNTNETGMVPNTNYIRNNINGSARVTLKEGLVASFNANYVKAHSDNLQQGGYAAENPVQQTIWSGRNVDLSALKDWKNLPLAPEGTAAAGTPLNWNTIYQNNPYWSQETNTIEYDKDRLFGNVQLNYTITDWLSAQVRTGIDTWSSRATARFAIGSNTYGDGFFTEIDRRFTEINHFGLITASKNFGDFSASLSVGGNSMEQVITRVTGEIQALQLPDLYTLSNLASGNTAILTNDYEEQRIHSVLATASFSFKDYAFLDVNVRNDWWSVLPVDNNSYLYPSASLSLVLTDMLGIYTSSMPYLKVRAGWSQVGSAGGLDPYDTQQTLSFRDESFGSTPRIFNPATLNNPNIKPETTTGYEFGVAAKFFDGKVSMDLTYYDQTSTDLIVLSQVTAASGYAFAWDNIGEMTNTGIEVQLGTKIIDNQDLKLGLDFNFATFNNEVVHVDNLDGDDGAVVLLDAENTSAGQWNVDVQAREGYPMGVLFGPGYAKDDEGNIIHEGGVPVIDENYQVLGDIQPDWTGGVGLNLSYKNISLNGLVDVKMGGDIYSMTTTWGRYAGVLEESLIGREVGIVGTGVKQLGDGTYVTNDVVVSAETYNKAAFSNDVAESSVFDASYVKFRQMTVNYQLPDRWFGKTPFRDFNIAFVGRNLGILYSKVPHIDPESAFSNSDGDQGLEFGQLPTARSLGFNINFKL